MKTLNIKITGTRPLLMHNQQLSDPMSAAAKAVAEISGKQKKSDADHEEMARREWMGGLYLDDELGPYIPGGNIEKMIRDGAAFLKKGLEINRSLMVEDEINPLEYDGPRTADALWAKMPHRDRRTVKLSRSSRVARTRPRFPAWSLSFTVAYEEERLNESNILKALEDAGRYVGLGDYRPKFGRFTVEVVK